VDSAKELPTVLSFCSGYGGIERGLELAGFEHRVIAYVEIEAFAIALLVKKMEEGKLPVAPVYTDIKTFPSEIFRDKVSLILGGYPCQGFSSAGKQKGDKDPRHLWPYIRRHIKSIRPIQCLFENVQGHIALGLLSVVSELESLRYRTTWGIFSALEVGALHERERVFILSNAIGSRSKIRLSGQERFNEKRHSRIAYNCCGKQCGWQEKMQWPPEPRLGRVVDGCPDRVDRIRLLGNGVVPQTAAKAWITLNKRMESLND